MKRFFTLTTLLLLVLSVSAQGYRKWDFTNWSAATIANLQAEATKGVTGGSWSDTEKADGSNPQPGNCYWSYGEANVIDGTLCANGAAIAETDGLLFTPAYVAKRSLAIAVNYPATSLGNYAGPQYLWLGGGNAKSASARIVCFTIPKVKIGQKITFVVESHKPSDARGISLFVKDATDDANQIGESFKPTTQESYTWENWTLPEGVTDEDGDGLVDILVYNTNGCHIYSIEVGTTDQKAKVAFLYNAAVNEASYGLDVLKSNDLLTVDEIDVSTKTTTVDELKGYDAVFISNTVTADNANAAVLKEALPWTPVVSVNPALYEAWGYGKAVASETPFLNVKNTNDELFRGVELIESDGIYGLSMSDNTPITGIELGDYFANDNVPAVLMDNEAVAGIHKHNINHNGYIYVPFGLTNNANAMQVLQNAVNAAINSKAPITALAAPSFKLEYKNMKTIVTLKSANANAIFYYTLDGSTPTEQSTKYTEPIEVTSELTIKAVAIAEGYTLSDVAEKKIDLKHQAAAPAINAEQWNGSTLITMSCETPDVNIYYNYSDSNDSTKSSKYTGPFEILTDKVITAFAASSTYVQSETTTKTATVNTPIVFTETLAHMDAAKDPYYTKEYEEAKTNSDSNSKVAYFFSWGKNKRLYPYYDLTQDPTITIDPETGEEIVTYPLSPEETFDFGNGWAIRSRGQVVCEEITIKPGNAIGDGSSYNPATVNEYEFSEQYPVTDCYLNISEWNTETDPLSAMIYTTQKLKGPFAILSYISNGNGGTAPRVVFETGNDIEGDATKTTWTQVGDTCDLNQQAMRLYRKFIRIYSGTDEVYIRTRIASGGSKAGFYDIYVLGIDPSYLTGIHDVTPHASRLTPHDDAAIYSLSGTQQQTLRRGLNIVVGSDGSVRKVLMK